MVTAKVGISFSNEFKVNVNEVKVIKIKNKGDFLQGPKNKSKQDSRLAFLTCEAKFL